MFLFSRRGFERGECFHLLVVETLIRNLGPLMPVVICPTLQVKNNTKMYLKYINFILKYTTKHIY